MKTEDLKNNKDYKYGFTTDVENIRSPKGLSEETIKFISNIKKEPNHDHKNHFFILKNLNISANSYTLNYT